MQSYKNSLVYEKLSSPVSVSTENVLENIELEIYNTGFGRYHISIYYSENLLSSSF